MKTIQSSGGPLIGIERTSLPQWGGVFHSSFFAHGSKFENDYEEMDEGLSRKSSTGLSMIKGASAEAVLIDLPLTTFIVDANGTSILLAQIWSSEQGWSEASITKDDVRRVVDWRGDVQFVCKGGEFIIFDSSCSYEDIGDYFSVSLDRGRYRCESSHEKRKGQAEIVLIRMLKQA